MNDFIRLINNLRVFDIAGLILMRNGKVVFQFFVHCLFAIQVNLLFGFSLLPIDSGLDHFQVANRIQTIF